jgi:DNA-3-methyladenine glycosylase II
MRGLESEADVARGLAFLKRKDPRLRPVIAACGAVELRRREHGFAGLARVVIGQQLSTASAEAIWTRFAALNAVLSPETLALLSDDRLRAAGLSSAKVRTLRAVAEECAAGLDLHALAAMPAEEARGRLMAISGIGPWTADIYLLFCLGHADVMPSGDLALQVAAGHALGLAGRPSARELDAIAAAWSPWRGVAAFLLWAYYRVIRRRDAAPV